MAANIKKSRGRAPAFVGHTLTGFSHFVLLLYYYM